MKRPTATSAFLASGRTFNWQTDRAVNAGPVVLHGQMAHYEKPGGTQWSGFALKPMPPEGRKTVSSRAWEEFLSAKRTIDPSYPTKVDPRRALSPPRPSTGGNLQALIASSSSYELLGCCTKSVERNGRVVYPNATSSDNVLKTNEYGSYRGREATRGESNPRPRGRASNEISRERGRSQVAELLGSQREGSEEVRSPQPARVKPDFESHITDLPGTVKRPERDPSPAKAVHVTHRNTMTSIEAEYYLGASPMRQGPRTVLKPSGDFFKSFQASEPEPRGRYHNYPAMNRILRGSMKDARPIRALKERPASMRDLFGSSITLA